MELENEQRTLMRSLCEFAVRVLCASPETPTSVAWHEDVWRRGIVPTFQRLCLCMTRLDQLEMQKTKEKEQGFLVQEERPKAPLGLLSLRDYSVLQAAIEVLFCWSAYPRVAAGVLLPVEKRRHTRTLAISTNVLTWGYRQYHACRDINDGENGQSEEKMRELLDITQVLLLLLSLPQLQPVLLPKYVVDLLALLVYGEVAVDAERVLSVRTEFVRLQDAMLRVLPLRMSMSSLRAALGQATPAASGHAACQRFKARCGSLLSRLLMEDGGIVATIEMMLGAVDEGNTQARMQVATLICKCPNNEDPGKYVIALCAQVRELLLAAVTPEKGRICSKLLGEMAALLADQVAARHPELFDTHILSVLFRPLLIYEDSRPDAMIASAKETCEEALTHCVSTTRLLICGPPPSQQLLQALTPIVRPLVHMYAFAATSKSFLASPLRAVLIAWIRSCPNAAVSLQFALLPVPLPLPPTLVACGYGRSHNEASWRPLLQFSAGGGGGISLRHVQSPVSIAGEQNDATGPLKAMIMPLVGLLGDKELETSDVVGDLFSSLLLTYMNVRKHGEAAVIDLNAKRGCMTSGFAFCGSEKIPMTAKSVEIVLMLLVALIECLGSSVLRSATTVLQCIGIVLEMYNTPVTPLVDKRQQIDSFVQVNDTDGEEEKGDEILIVCLGVVLTILEMGSAHRSDSEEQQLREMLPVLEILSCHERPEAAGLASEVRARILSRSAVEAITTNTVRAGEQSFEELLEKAEQDLSSELVPLRARGIVTLTKLVRQSHLHSRDSEWTSRVHVLARVFLAHLHDAESYVFLAAVQGLAALADVDPDVAIPALVKALRDDNESLEARIKLSEALLFSARRCGETLPKYGKLFVYAYLDCIRPSPSQTKRVKSVQDEASTCVQLVQEVQMDEVKVEAEEKVEHSDNGPENEQELHVAATLRASCLSNLAEVCVLLQWGLQPYLLDVLTCVFGVLQLELEVERDTKHRPMPVDMDVTEDHDRTKLRRHQAEEWQQRVVAVRRGAVFVLRYLVELLGWKILELMPDQLLPLYRALKHVARVDRDDVVVFHANRALSVLDDVMRAELFPSVGQHDAAFCISSLRIS
ncbi:unnamed protein product [Hyaloperonospora brassicae]|uniref:RNA polymerase II assembly factor Rtp1 C-terminal domain-containing protein n=1 Tax=Hyaloperonospora brassicae TaxID=162125 RepID=A0AAV0TEI6_HYABA|nr:unnamed protein product [Hyaloperonospora brassicae]